MSVFIIATKNCSHCTGLRKELDQLGICCDVMYAEDHPELVEKYQIRHSPYLIVDEKVVFRRQPAESELKALFAG